jgi:zinc/manganese transport system substrate-binding protein
MNDIAVRGLQCAKHGPRGDGDIMRRFLLVILVATMLLPGGADAAKKLRIVTTIPDLADITRNVGGDFVDVASLATGVEDIHAVPMKPSFAVLLNRADAVVLMGLEAEHAFLPALLEASRNPKIQRDMPGYIDCSIYVTPLEAPTRLDRSLGDVHPMGNPHFNLDPVNGRHIVRAIVDGLSRLDPEHGAVFQKNGDAYKAKLDEAIVRWQREAAPLKGKKIVTYHPDMIYFAERFGMIQFGTIEIRPGVDPTPAHVAELIERMRQAKVEIVIRELHYPAGLAETVAKSTGAKLVELPAMVRGVPEAKDYFALIDYNVRTLVKAVTGGSAALLVPSSTP